MSIRFWVCLTAGCTTWLYKTPDGRCPRCGGEGHPKAWTLKPPRPPS